MADIEMNLAWAINGSGALVVDLDSNGSTLSSMTLDISDIEEALIEDLEDFREDPTYDLADWLLFRDHTENMLAMLNKRLGTMTYAG